MSVFIDSDIIIEVLRGRDQQVIATWRALAHSSAPILISPVTVAEIGAGARPSEMQGISRLFAPLICVPIDQSIGELAGEYMRKYGKSHNVKVADALIAASAVHNGAALWTRNRKHYPMQGLTFHA